MENSIDYFNLNTLSNTTIPCSDVVEIIQEKIIDQDKWFGYVIWEDGTSYKGGFKGKNKHGYGMYTLKTGNTIECIWVNDMPKLDIED